MLGGIVVTTSAEPLGLPVGQIGAMNLYVCTRCGSLVVFPGIHITRCCSGEQSVAAIAERDAYKFVLSRIATGDCEDPVKLARDVLAEGRITDLTERDDR